MTNWRGKLYRNFGLKNHQSDQREIDRENIIIKGQGDAIGKVILKEKRIRKR